LQKLWRLSLADILISILDIAFLIGLLYLVRFYTQNEPAGTNPAFPFYLLHEHPEFAIGMFFLLFTIKNIAGFIVSRSQYHFVYGVASRISKDGLLQYLHGPYADYIHVDSSVMNRKINQQPIEFSHYVLNGVQQIFNQSVQIIVTLTAIIIFNPRLIPLLILILVPPVLVISAFMKRRLHAGRLRGKTASEKSIQHLQEALTGYVESNTNLKNDFFTSRYRRFQAELNQYLAERLSIQNMPSRFIEIFAVFSLFLLISLNELISHNHSISFLTLGALMVAAYKIIPGVVKITNTTGQIKTYAYSIRGLKEYKATPENYPEYTEPIDSVGFKNVSFHYGEKCILADFSMNLEKGNMMGIRGVSGKGKTTIINLLLGFLSPDAGKIYYNNQITDTGAIKKFWPGVSYLKQQHFFLHASVVENISFEEENYDENKLRKIFILTGVDKIISLLPKGADELITENGKNLSGGQRQRLLLARALYKNFDLLLLDEPFNELDETAEMELLRQLQVIAADGKMILLITHSTRALSFCNKIIELDAQGS
jgi:ABC-type multidrug transport system fused ATPase/permease subunit